MGKFQNLSGKTFGRLTVISLSHIKPDGKPQWFCRCECGNIKIVTSWNLKVGVVSSCGCLVVEKNKAMATHNEARKTKEYFAWAKIKGRCLNPNLKAYPDYGGRGIKICVGWQKSYPDFLASVGRAPSPKHSIDRINNNGHYEPGNVKWSTAKEQANNRRPRKKKVNVHSE